MGESELRGTIEVLSPDGSLSYSRTASLFVLSTDTEVLVGRSGFLLLHLAHLDHERAAGRMSDADYARERERVLGK
jgi:hypothetical protein